MADLDVIVYGRGSPPQRFQVGPAQTLQATPSNETLHATATVAATFEVGLAASYPGDISIESHPSVIFVERFEGTMAALQGRWTDYVLTTSEFSADVPSGSPGTQSLRLIQNRITQPQSEAKLFQNFTDQTGPVYVRCYLKYPSAATFPGHGGIWVGGNEPHNNFPYVPANTLPPTVDSGDNWFSAGVEVVDPDTGRVEHYNYWPAMHADGTGGYWGNYLLMDASVTVAYDTWFCLEVMVKPNSTVDAYDGEHAFWLNGVKVSHLGLGFPHGTWSGNRFTQNPGDPGTFEGFRWRTIAALEGVNWVWLQAYDGAHDAVMLVDHLVVAGTYIGPMVAVSNVTFTWSAVPSATTYLIEVGTSYGLSDTLAVTISATSTSYGALLAAGTHYVRIRATVGGVLGAPSEEWVVVVP